MPEFLSECEPELRRLLAEEREKYRTLEREVLHLKRLIAKQTEKREGKTVAEKVLKFHAQ